MFVYVLMMCWYQLFNPGNYFECKVEGVFRDERTAWQASRVLCHDDPNCNAKSYVFREEVK